MSEREQARWVGGLPALIVLNNSAYLKAVKTAGALPYSLRVQAGALLLCAYLMGEWSVCVLVSALWPASSSSSGSLSINESCTWCLRWYHKHTSSHARSHACAGLCSQPRPAELCAQKHKQASARARARWCSVPSESLLVISHWLASSCFCPSVPTLLMFPIRLRPSASAPLFPWMLPRLQFHISQSSLGILLLVVLKIVIRQSLLTLCSLRWVGIVLALMSDPPSYF